MCIEDIRIGRQSDSQIKSTALAVGVASNVLQANTNRIAIIASASTTTGCILSPEGQDPVAGNGIFLSLSQTPMAISIQEAGRILIGGWRASAVGAACTITIIDTSTTKT